MQDCTSAINLQDGKLAAKQMDVVPGYGMTKLQLMSSDFIRIHVKQVSGVASL